MQIKPWLDDVLPTTLGLEHALLYDTWRFLRDADDIDPITLINIFDRDYIADGNKRAVVAYRMKIPLEARHMTYGQSVTYEDSNGTHDITYDAYLLTRLLIHRVHLRRKGLVTLKDIIDRRDALEFYL